MSDLREITAALRRLEKSDTPRKRRNARLAFNRALRALASAIADKYPTMRVRRRPRGAQCPYCRWPAKTFRVLAVHLYKHHHKVSCPCGFRGVTSRHLAGIKDLKAHFAKAELKTSLNGAAHHDDF